MSAIRAVLKEELSRLNVLLRKYKQELKKFPIGSISKKERKGRFYAYLAFRKGEKVHFKYLGSAGSERVLVIESKIKSRREYERRLRLVVKEIRELERAVYGRQK